MPSHRAAPELHPLTVDLPVYGERLSCPTVAEDPVAAAHSLARALAASPCAGRISDGVVVVRERPTPRLGLLARVDDADRPWLSAALAALQGTVRRLRRVRWPEVEAAAESLARGLRHRLGRDRLAAAAVRGVPRGGAIAAGLLAYALDLPAAAFDREPGPDRLTLLVDDCALTGARFRQRLGRLPEGEVAFATLFSPPDLRRAIEGTERRVVACVGGRDLTDHAPTRLGSDHEAWVRRWRERSGDRVYWIGQPDHLAFPWSEPEASVWDEERGEEAPAFSVVPPDLCLAGRSGDDPGPEIQVQPTGPGPLRPAPRLLWGALDGCVVIRHLDAGRELTLRGTAAAMWRALVRCGDRASAGASLAASFDAPAGRIRRDLDGLTRRLLERGALVEDAPAAGSGPGERAVPVGGEAR